MERIPEPELMESAEQARAYAEADFEEAHSHIVAQFQRVFPSVDLTGTLLDLGCGPGDIAFRFATQFPSIQVIGVDGSRAMLELGRERANREGMAERISLIEGLIPGVELPRPPFEAIVSNSLLHHLHDPRVLWDTIRLHSESGTRIFIADLMRPPSESIAHEMMERYSEGEPEVLKRDFYNSLLAAFEVGEVEEQIREAGLGFLRVEPISDRHLLVWGRHP